MPKNQNRTRPAMSQNLKLCALAVMAVVVSPTLTGCVGMSAPYGSQTIEPASIDLIPVTGELIADQIRAGLEAEATTPDWSPKVADYIYRIKPGDIMFIAVPTIVSFNTSNAPAFVSDQDQGYVVYNDGTIFLPYAGSVMLAGSTQKEAQEKIVKALSGFLRSPQIVVAVKEFRSQRVMVTGQVEKPGYLPITDVPLTLIGALSTVGGIFQQRGSSDPRQVGLSTTQTGQNPLEYPDLKNVVLKRGGKTYKINTDKLLASGDLAMDPVLLDGDVVVVPTKNRASVFMLGEITRPGLLEVDRDTDLAKALTGAGGIVQLSANASRVYVIRGDYKKPTVYQLDAGHPDSMLLAQKFVLQPNDVIYVSETRLTRFNRGLNQILPSIQSLLSTAIIVNTVDNLN